VTDQVIAVDGLVKRYGDQVAVNDVTFNLQRGEVLALLGPNGAGKTSTVEMLCGFRNRDGGTIRVLGDDPGTRDGLRAIRSKVGVVLQEAGGHYRFLTVRETLQMHRGYHTNPRSAEEVLDLVELTDSADKRVRELSGGQQRRLDVAVALIGHPELIFLDEPTTGFDPAARRRAWDTIASLTQLGVSVLLTTHYMEEAQHLADRVAVIRQGRIVGSGTPVELARMLELRSRLTFTLPERVQVADLPPQVREHGVDELEAGTIRISTSEPTQLMADLCGWAVEHAVKLEEMELRAPSLEDSYLTLTGGDA
jgi:ABC-2 type transport system ATP-binding protein